MSVRRQLFSSENISIVNMLYRNVSEFQWQVLALVILIRSYRNRSFTRIEASISCRWQTRATRCVTANVLQTNNVDAQCDKLATELSWQRFASKVAIFQLPQVHLIYPTCIWRLRWGWTPFEFCWDFGHQKTRVPGLSCGVVCAILRLAVSVEHRLVSDRRTDTRRQLIPALAIVELVK